MEPLQNGNSIVPSGEIMNLIKQIGKLKATVKERGVVIWRQIFPKEEPLSTLTPYGRLKYWEIRRTQQLLRGQQQRERTPQ